MMMVPKLLSQRSKHLRALAAARITLSEANSRYAAQLLPAEPRPEEATDCPMCEGRRMSIYRRCGREYPSRCNKCFGRGWIETSKGPIKYS